MGAYKSMSWSTSIRERAKLGRLDSEPPLLLREWPPETGRRNGETGRGAGKQKGGEAEEQGGHKQLRARGETERKRERAEFTRLLRASTTIFIMFLKFSMQLSETKYYSLCLWSHLTHLSSRTYSEAYLASSFGL